MICIERCCYLRGLKNMDILNYLYQEFGNLKIRSLCSWLIFFNKFYRNSGTIDKQYRFVEYQTSTYCMDRNY